MQYQNRELYGEIKEFTDSITAIEFLKNKFMRRSKLSDESVKKLCDAEIELLNNISIERVLIYDSSKIEIFNFEWFLTNNRRVMICVIQ